jgi:uncharacterized membrane protein
VLPPRLARRSLISRPHVADTQTLLNATFFTLNGLALIALSIALGAVMAALAFVAGAFAMPMLLDRRVDLIEATATSFTAVMLNLPTMVLWAAMLVVLTVAGMATFYIGLIVTLPLAGHATWHAYRAVIKPEARTAGFSRRKRSMQRCATACRRTRRS